MLDEFLAEIPGVAVDRDTTFAALTTLRVGGSPAYIVNCQSADAAIATLRELDTRGVKYLVVGGGSNLLAADGPHDLVVVRLQFSACEIAAGEATAVVRAEAGLVWDDLVAQTVAAGLGGIECLSGIPGHCGAVPVQNVGAYGAEIADVLTQVYLYDRATRQASWVPAAALELGYRYSNLKFTGRGVILAIELQLRADGLSIPLRFGQLSAASGQRRPVADVRAEVLELRRSKGMVLDAQDHDTWSAGSFFTNPVVDSALAAEICARVRREHGDAVADRMPRHVVSVDTTSQREKLSAAWLIERAGFAKGYPGAGPATLSTQHTLALTNRGGATAADIVSLAREIRAGVHQAFGVQLEPEPIFLGVTLD